MKTLCYFNIGRQSPPGNKTRSSRRLKNVLLKKGVLKICNKFTGEHPWRSAISITLLATLLKSHSAWVLSNKLAAYFQFTFSYEHLWKAASARRKWNVHEAFRRHPRRVPKV